MITQILTYLHVNFLVGADSIRPQGYVEIYDNANLSAFTYFGKELC